MKNAAIAILAVACIILAVCLCRRPTAAPTDRIVVRTDTVTVTRIDTIAVTLAVPVAAREVGTVRDTLLLASSDSVASDSAEVIVPIVQSHYGGEEYDLWVSGYRTSLDSLYIYTRTREHYITATTEKRPSRWGIGVTAGYGMTPRGLQPYVGVAVTYTLIRF